MLGLAVGESAGVGARPLQPCSPCFRWRARFLTLALVAPSPRSSPALLSLSSPQVYSANRYGSSPKGRWLARGVDVLLHQYPSLRVAFIDTFTGDKGKTQYSVLIRGQVGTPASDPDGTQELYR